MSRDSGPSVLTVVTIQLNNWAIKKDGFYLVFINNNFVSLLKIKP